MSPKIIFFFFLFVFTGCKNSPTNSFPKVDSAALSDKIRNDKEGDSIVIHNLATKPTFILDSIFGDWEIRKNAITNTCAHPQYLEINVKMEDWVIYLFNRQIVIRAYTNPTDALISHRKSYDFEGILTGKSLSFNNNFQGHVPNAEPKTLGNLTFTDSHNFTGHIKVFGLNKCITTYDVFGSWYPHR